MQVNASQRANSWAAQRSQAIEKAKQLREERKFNLAKAGEMSVANEMGANQFGRITSSEAQQREYQRPMMDYNQKKPATMKYGMSPFDQEPEEDMGQAKNSLMLLKSKMRDQTGYSSVPKYPEEKPRYENYQYKDYNQAGNRQMPQDRGYNDTYQNDNSNYRKVFKPDFGGQQGYSQGNQGYSQGNKGYSQGNQGFSQGNSYGNSSYSNYSNTNYSNNNYNNYDMGGDKGGYKKSNTMERQAPYGNSNSYQDQYAPSNQYSRQSQQQQPMNKYGGGRDPYQQQQQQYENYDDFSPSNVPSRISKNSVSSNKGNPYDNGLDSQYNNSKYGGYSNNNRASMEDDYSANRNYNKPPSYEPKVQKTVPANQKNQGYERNVPKPNTNKGWQNNDEYEDDRGAFQSKPFGGQANNKKAQLPPSGPSKKRGNQDTDDDRPLRAANNELPPEYDNTGPLEDCPHGCGRRFNADAIDKHAAICQKVFQSKRKKFDSSQHRLTEDQAKLGYENKYNKKPAQQKKPSGPSGGGKAGAKPKWKQQSEVFRANLKAARGGALTQQEQANVAQANSDMLVPCHNCGRRFNEVAAARHIPFCETKQNVRNPVKVGKRRY